MMICTVHINNEQVATIMAVNKSKLAEVSDYAVVWEESAFGDHIKPRDGVVMISGFHRDRGALELLGLITKEITRQKETEGINESPTTNL